MANQEHWAQFCDALKKLGEDLFWAEAPKDDFNRAEGYRYLTRLLRDGLMRQVEFSDPQFPVLYDLNQAWVSIGGNPDNDYLIAFIDGRNEYRLSGRRNSVHYLGISTKAGGYEKDGTLAPSGFLDSHNLVCAADGSFEIAMSRATRPGNWLAMSEKSSNLIIRQTFLDRDKEKAAEFRMECISGDRQPKPLDADKFPNRLMGALKYAKANIEFSGNWTRQFQTRPNEFYPFDQSVYLQAGGDPTIFYAQGYWELKPDEALVIDVPNVECSFWNFQINNYWQEVVGFNQATSHYNRVTSIPDKDGNIRLVVAHDDPHMPNWLPTLGHRLGTMTFRFIDAVDPVFPGARLVKRSGVGT